MASTRISDIRGPLGPEGPVGPAGPNSVPTDEFMAEKADDPASAFGVSLAAKIDTALDGFDPGLDAAELVDVISAPGAPRDAVDARVIARLAGDSAPAAGAAAAIANAMATAYLGYTLVYGTGDGTEVWTVTSGAPVYNAAGKFGTALSGGGRIISDAGSVPAPAVGAVLFFECWVKNAAPPSAIKVIGGLGGAPYVAAEPTTGFASLAIDGTAKVISNVNVCDGAWHHLAFQIGRNGTANTYTNFWVDGVPQGGTPTIGGSTWVTQVTMGGLAANATYNWPGQIDELRVSKTARYSGTFTPPAAPFVWDAACLLLAHFNDSTYIAPAGGYPLRPPSAPPGAVTYVGLVQPTGALTADAWDRVAT